jgi:threonyl-tRNA synthetase
MSTIQLDFQLPQRFGIEFSASDNTRQQPIMIHRALFGSVERFFGVLTEHYAGAFPAWLSPVQVRVLGVRNDHDDHAAAIAERLRSSGFRAESVEADEPLGQRIRRSKLEKVPFILVVGDDDVAAGTVGVNVRGSDRPERGVPVDDFVGRLRAEAMPPDYST